MEVVGKMRFNITFLSPIEVGDWTKWSIPFSYLAVEAQSLDGEPHTVQVYSDISGEWLSGDRSAIMTWETSSTSPNIVHNMTLSLPRPYTSIIGQASWGNWYYATPSGANVTYQIDSDEACRTAFQTTGKLNNRVTSPPRAISTNFPVLALSYDLGSITSTSAPLVWTIGFDRNPALQITDLSKTQQDRALYYRARYTSTPPLVADVLSDYASALARATALDANLTAQAAAAPGGGQDLANLVALAARQVIANTELTVGRGSDGQWNSSDAMLFMREGDINYNRTQPVELLYASFPLFMSLDPRLGAPLLEPLLRLQDSSSYSVGYAAQDLGSAYPNVTIQNNQQAQGVEMSGNMLIMSYAQARFSGDGSLVQTYYGLLRTWADYLVNNSLSVSTQFSTDTTTTHNQTNLAIKGIIGVKAFAQIASSLGVSDDASTYTSQASSLYAQWKAAGALSSSGNLLGTFGVETSFATGYNLLADKWLDLGVVEAAVYAAQTAFIKGTFGTGSSVYGIPADSSSGTDVNVAWNMFVASSMKDTSVSSDLIGRLAARAGLNSTPEIWSVLYDGTTGEYQFGRSSPGVGAVFAPLALALPVKPFSASPGWSPPARTAPGRSSGRGSHSDAGAIAGGVVGGVLGAVALCGLFWWVWRRKRRSADTPNANDITPNPAFYIPDASPSPVLGAPPSDSQPHVPPSDSAASRPPRPLPSPPTLLSSKALMELRRAQAQQDVSAVNSRAALTRMSPSASELAGSSAPAASTSGAGTSSVELQFGREQTEASLRAQLNLLRREVAEIRATGGELPPTYEAA